MNADRIKHVGNGDLAIPEFHPRTPQGLMFPLLFIVVFRVAGREYG